MAKPKTYTLDCSDEYDQELSEAAVTLWITRYPAYTFAYHLNNLFELNLEYSDPIVVDIDGQEATVQAFIYQDTTRQLNYVLIENHTLDINDMGQRDFSQYDKTLIISGFEALQRMEEIRNELTNRTPLYSDDTQREREAQRLEIMDNGIIESAGIDFSDTDNPVIDSLMLPKNNKRALQLQKFLATQTDFLRNILYAIDNRIPDFEDGDIEYSIIHRE